jgi:hypothetical protein
VTFVEAVRAAMDTHDNRAYISRVKEVVRAQIASFDSSASIDDTHYFNHSAIPDFVVTWPGEKGDRKVYLRDSYEAIAAAQDEEYLANLEPMLLSLDESDGSFDAIERRADSAAREIGALDRPSSLKNPRTLVTDVGAVDVISRIEANEQSPVSELIRANLVRGGRGVIDEPRAESLVGGAVQDADAEVLPFSDVEGMIAANFVEDAAARITRTAQLVDIALRGGEMNSEQLAAVIRGRMSTAELRHLLPWLLKQDRARQNVPFWRHVGSMLDLESLERLRDDLDGLDVSPIVSANSDRWEAKWGYAGLSVGDFDDDGSLPAEPRWAFEGGRLGVSFGSLRILIAWNGQFIKARDGSSSALWEHIRQPLANYQLTGVSLSGIRRSVSVDAQQSPDVRGDVDEIVNSLEDNYFVSRVSVRARRAEGIDGAADVEVNLGGGVVHALPGASVRTLVEVASQVLNYRAPVRIDVLEKALGSSRRGGSAPGHDDSGDTGF